MYIEYAQLCQIRLKFTLQNVRLKKQKKDISI
jgi:hypothetical protein